MTYFYDLKFNLSPNSGSTVSGSLRYSDKSMNFSNTLYFQKSYFFDNRRFFHAFSRKTHRFFIEIGENTHCYLNNSIILQHFSKNTQFCKICKTADIKHRIQPFHPSTRTETADRRGKHRGDAWRIFAVTRGNIYCYKYNTLIFFLYLYTILKRTCNARFPTGRVQSRLSAVSAGADERPLRVEKRTNL